MKKALLILIIILLAGVIVGLIGFGVYKSNEIKNEPKAPEIEILSIEDTTIIEQEEIEIPKILNFNDYYEVVYDETTALQEKVDAGMLVGAYGDYYHHNTRDFLDLFWILDKVEEIQIDGKSYTFVEYTEAELQMSDGSILKNDGTIVEENGKVEIITCQAEESNPARFVAILETK